MLSHHFWRWLFPWRDRPAKSGFGFALGCSLLIMCLGGSAARAELSACADVNAPANTCMTQVLILTNKGKKLLRTWPMQAASRSVSIGDCKLETATPKFLSSGTDLLLYGLSAVQRTNDQPANGRLCRLAQEASAPDPNLLDSSIGGSFDIKNSNSNLTLAWADAAHLAQLENPGTANAQVRFYDALPRRDVQVSPQYLLNVERPDAWQSNELPSIGNDLANADLLINAGTAQLMVAKLSQSRVLRLTAVETPGPSERSTVQLSYSSPLPAASIKALVPLAPAPLNVNASTRLARQMGAIALMDGNNMYRGGIAFIPGVRVSNGSVDQTYVIDPSSSYYAAAVAWERPPLAPEQLGPAASGLLVTSYKDVSGQFKLTALPLNKATLASADNEYLSFQMRPSATMAFNDAVYSIAVVPRDSPGRYAVLALSSAFKAPRWYELNWDGTVFHWSAPTEIAPPDDAPPYGQAFTTLRPLVSVGSARLINLAVGNAAQGQAYGNLPLKVLGGSKPTLIVAAGDCRATSVKLLFGDAERPTRQRELLSPLDKSVRFSIDTTDRVWLRFGQQLGAGEDCTLRIISYDEPSMYTSEALVRVQSGKLDNQALALVLDTSTSMNRRIPRVSDGNPYSQAAALGDALRGFSGLLSLIPDAQAMDIFLTSFGSTASPAQKLTASSLRQLLADPSWAVQPSGETNILAGLASAAAALTDVTKTTKPHKAMFLLTDGQHNFNGDPQAAADADQLELRPTSPPPEGPMLMSGSQLVKQAKAERFFATGISPYAEHPALNRLARNANDNLIGGADFVTTPTMLESAFLRVLWRLLSVSFLKRDEGSLTAAAPTHPEQNTNMVSIPVSVSSADSEIFVTAVGSRPDSQLALAIELNQKELVLTGHPWCVPQQSGGVAQGNKFVACRLAQSEIAGLSGQLTIKLTNLGHSPTDYRLEVAARSNVELTGTFTQGSRPAGLLVTDAPVTLDVTLRSHNVPVQATRVSARIWHPQRSVGSLLADDELAQKSLTAQDYPLTDDTSGVLSKLQRLMAVIANSLTPQDTELDLAPVNEVTGVYRLVFSPTVSGPYEIEVTVAGSTATSVVTPHSQVFSTYVETGLDCPHSITMMQRTDGANGTGTIQAMIKPNDGKGSYLGPNRASAIGFEQSGNPGLRWSPPVDDPALNGLYAVQLTGVQDGPVFLVTDGGRCELTVPMADGGGHGAVGCSCELGAHPPARPLPAAVTALMSLLFLLRRIGTRRRAARGAARID